MTTLTFHFLEPRDLLLKLARDGQRLREAVECQDLEKIADCLFDFSNTAYCIKDWLKHNRSATFTEDDVEEHVHNTIVLNACREICNANKHHTIKAAAEAVEEVLTSNLISAVAQYPHIDSGVPLEAEDAPTFRVKVVLSDESRHEVTYFADEVIAAWTEFFTRHALLARPEERRE